MCIVDALSNCVSRCPICDLPGWLKDLKGNKQLGNIVHLLTCMEEQISPRSSVNSMSLSYMLSANDMEKQQDTPGTLCHDPYNAVISAAFRSEGDKCVLLKPQMETKFIKRCLKSRLSPRASTISASNIVNDTGSLPINEVPGDLKKGKGDLHVHTSELTVHSIKSGKDFRKPVSIKQSLSKMQEFVSCASNTCRHDTDVDVEFEDQIDVQFSLVMKTRALDTNDKVLGVHESKSHSQKYFVRKASHNKPKIQQISVTSLTSGGIITICTWNYTYELVRINTEIWVSHPLEVFPSHPPLSPHSKFAQV